jgi:hypothetical protein
MNDDKEAIQAQLDAIEKPGGSKHEAWLRKDGAVMQEREGCYKKMFPEPPMEPPPPLPAGS